MKKTIMLKGLIFLVVITGFFFTACSMGGSSSSKGKGGGNPFLGTWTGMITLTAPGGGPPSTFSVTVNFNETTWTSACSSMPANTILNTSGTYNITANTATLETHGGGYYGTATMESEGTLIYSINFIGVNGYGSLSGGGNPFLGTWTGMININTGEGYFMATSAEITFTETSWNFTGGIGFSGTYTKNGNTATLLQGGTVLGTATLTSSTQLSVSITNGAYAGSYGTFTGGSSGSNPFIGTWTGTINITTTGGPPFTQYSSTIIFTETSWSLSGVLSGSGTYTKSGNTATLLQGGTVFGIAMFYSSTQLDINIYSDLYNGSHGTFTGGSSGSNPFIGTWTGTLNISTNGGGSWSGPYSSTITFTETSWSLTTASIPGLSGTYTRSGNTATLLQGGTVFGTATAYSTELNVSISSGPYAGSYGILTGGSSGSNPFIGTWTGTLSNSYGVAYSVNITFTETSWSLSGGMSASGTYTRDTNTATLLEYGMTYGTAVVYSGPQLWVNLSSGFYGTLN